MDSGHMRSFCADNFTNLPAHVFDERHLMDIGTSIIYISHIHICTEIPLSTTCSKTNH